MNRKNLDRTIRFLLVIGIVTGSILFLYYMSKVTYPFLIAIAIALLINPIVRFLEIKWRFPRSLAVLTTLLLVIGVFAGLITLLIAEIAAGAAYLSTVVPEHVGTFIAS